MQRFFLLLAAMALLVLGTSSKAEDNDTVPKRRPKGSQEEIALVKGNNAFAFDLYAKLRDKKGPLFFSPYSISTALAMTYAGARGKTAAEMARTLHFTLGANRLHPAFKNLITDLNASGRKETYRLHVANALWAQKGYPFRPEFIKLALDDYQGEAILVDFRRPDRARRAINAWVEKKTQDKIKELFKPDTLDPRTRLVLTNAIYFKAPWHYKFPKQATKKGKFRRPGAKPFKKVPLMHLTSNSLYYEGENFQLLELAYKGDELAMVVLLPKKVDGLAALEKKLAEERLEGWLKRVQTYQVDITLPRLKITAEFDLENILSAMGMRLAFSNNADLSGMTESNDLKITKVVHKAFMKVNEEGTEAAAATGVRVGLKLARRGSSKPRAIFRADHPFVLLIRHRRSDSILFLGRVTNPQASRQ
jgi:serpin B